MKRVLFLFIAFCFVVVTSCKKEDGIRPVKKEVAPEVINGNGEKRLPTHDGGE